LQEQIVRPEIAAGQNNSNPTPYAASAAKGEWELIARSSSHPPFTAEAVYGVGLLLF
jgi:hypothetical protein